MNYNSPDYKPDYEELTACLYKEMGDDIILDISAKVYGSRVYDVSGVMIFNDRKGYELASVPMTDENLKIAEHMFKIDLEQKLYESAYE